MHEPEPPALSPLQTIDVGADVDAVEINLELEAEVEVVDVGSGQICSRREPQVEAHECALSCPI